MKTPFIFLCAVLVILGSSCTDPEPPETLFQGKYSDADMDNAMANARKNIHVFEKALTSGIGENHAVKVAIRDGEETEHFWLTEVKPYEGGFKGALGNDPGMVTNVKFGDEITAKGDGISDWMYMDGDKMHGNYTLRVMLPGMPKDEADIYRASLAPLPE